VTTTHSLTVLAGRTLDLAGHTLSDPGTLSNAGLITLNGGKIIHHNDGFSFTDSSGGAITSYVAGTRVYLTLSDANRNLNGASVENVTTTVTTSGGDSENITLVETSAASGIFRSTSGPFIVLQNVPFVVSDGTLEASSAGNVLSTYTDNQDNTDTANATMPFTDGSSGGGGGGTGGGGATIPSSSGVANGVVPQQQTLFENNLLNLQNIGVAVHSLVKLPCTGFPGVNDPCKAVYYVGADGKRHAFPNEKVYFTWYSDFNGVQLINSAQMASIPLGANVTYKPGVKMVKFTTDNKVYVVQKGGILRWVTTADLAAALYGSNWIHIIDDISDAFYTNYQFGTDVNSTADYSPSAAEASVTFPSDSLQM